ncbi:MAG: glutamate--tRNA ligase [bacterium]
MVNQVRTRFAPSPTGYMHIGNFRTALYTFLFARHNKGTYILRLEDTDRARYNEEAIEIILKTLAWAGIRIDEGFSIGGDYGSYVQSERLEIYKKYAEELVEKGKAYYCFCSKERIEDLRKEQEAMKLASRYDKRCRGLKLEEAKKRIAKGEPYVIRQAMPEGEISSFEDLVYGKISVNSDELEDQILMKSDGYPTYNFANVADDHLMKISHIIRGSEFLSSTPKFNLLYEAFGWQPPLYVHLPVLTDEHHRKLSKRSGDVAMDDFIKKGYTKEAIINYVALLGWNPGDDREILSIDDLIKEFSVDKIHKNPAVFDYKKLNWMNGEYLRKMSLDDFHEFVKGFYEIKNEQTFVRFPMKKISRLLHNRVEVPADMPEMINFIFELPEYSIELYTHKKSKTDMEISLRVLLRTIEVFTALEKWDEEKIKELLLKLCEEMNLKTGQVMWPVRIALSGKEFTPGGAPEIADILGKEECLSRLKIGLDKFKSK